MREEASSGPRYVALVGLMGIALGAAAILRDAGPAFLRGPYLIGSGWGTLFFLLGFCGLLYHAASEKDLQYRRVYAMLGVLFWVIGVGLRLLPYEYAGTRMWGGLWLAYGSPAMLLALGFLAAYTRHETDEKVRFYFTNLIAFTGIALALLGAVVGYFSEAFLVTHGLAALLLGLLYLGVFVGLEGTASPRGYYGGLALSLLGGVMFAAALIRSVGPFVLYWIHLRSSMPTDNFTMPSGLVLMYAGLEYLAMGWLICSDRPLAVLTRRELASYFYSPIAYVVIVGMAVIGWFMYAQFVGRIMEASEQVAISPGGMSRYTLEPIVFNYVVDIFPIICVIFIVPVLTMRQLSEERRTGTLEVLLTAPVSETPVVLSKFLAAFRMYLLCWYPWALYLIAFRVESGQEFDYRPLLAFFFLLAASGAGFLAMGLFFSAVTRSQIAAAILTFVGMIFLTLIYWLAASLPQESSLPRSWSTPPS